MLDLLLVSNHKVRCSMMARAACIRSVILVTTCLGLPTIDPDVCRTIYQPRSPSNSTNLLTSDPSVATAKPTAAATPEPELDPPGSANGQYGLVHWPPRDVHPEVAFVDR